jgi:dihydroorotate dehydrogenase (NAD+) catalytic subunit
MLPNMNKTLPSFYDPTKTYDDNFDNGPFHVPGDEITYVNEGEPKFSFLGHPVYSPFGIPAGSLLNSNYVKYAFEHGFDVCTYKTQRSGEYPVNPFPNVIYVKTDGDLTLEKAAKSVVGSTSTDLPADKITITNSFAMPSRGPEMWVPDLQKAIACENKGQFLIASVVGTPKEGFSTEDFYKDFADVAGVAASAKPKAVELNLSCPNVAGEGVLCYNYDNVRAVRMAKDKVGDIPMGIKLGYFSADQQELLEKIIANIAPYISYIATINTIAAPVVNESGEQALPGKGRLISGVCGAGVKWAGLDMVHRLKQFRQKRGYNYEIVGVGGVMNAADFHEYRRAGADLVQSCTGAMWNPSLAAEIKKTL